LMLTANCCEQAAIVSMPVTLTHLEIPTLASLRPLARAVA
jgi:hypothetical protein